MTLGKTEFYKPLIWAIENIYNKKKAPIELPDKNQEVEEPRATIMLGGNNITIALHWNSTEEGFSYWQNLHNFFIAYYKNFMYFESMNIDYIKNKNKQIEFDFDE